MARVPNSPARPAVRPSVTPQARTPATPQPAPRPSARPVAQSAARAPAKVESRAVARPDDAVPEHMRNMAGMGTERVGAGDIETPRIKLIQGLSPEIQTFEDAKPGQFWHTTAQISFGPDVEIVPVYTDIRAILWRPREAGGGILARSDDGVTWNPANTTFEVKLDRRDGGHVVKWTTKPTVAASRLLEWGSMNPTDPNSQPAATKMYNLVVCLPEYPELGPAVVTLQRSGVKVARKFMGQLKLIRAPSFGCRFIMASLLENGPSGDFYNYSFRANGFVEDEDEFEAYKQWYETFKAQGLTIQDLEGLQGTDADEAAGASAEGAPAY